MDYRELAEVFEKRRSVRRYTDEPVADEDLERMLAAFRWAPSGSNKQPWFLIACRDSAVNSAAAGAIREEVAAIGQRHPAFRATAERLVRYSTFFENAPLVFYVCGEPQQSSWRTTLRELEPEHPAAGSSQSWLVSTAAAIQNLLLAVHALGYGACWLGAPLIARGRLETLLEPPSGRRLVAIIPVGRPAEEPAAPRRRPAEETIRRQG
jgi:nitroreductase